MPQDKKLKQTLNVILRINFCTGFTFKLKIFTVTEKANILENECKLKDAAGRVLTNPSDPNTASPQPTIWTNNVIWHEADTKWDAKYTLTETPPAPDPTGVSHYVTDFKYGIVQATTKLVLERSKWSPKHTLLNNSRSR